VMRSAEESVTEPNDLEDIRSRYRNFVTKTAQYDPVVGPAAP